MTVVRGRGGRLATIEALWSQVHPVFMLPPLAASAFGAIQAAEVSLLPAGIHLSAIFFAVYTAHIKDGYIDFHVRGEDDDHPMTASGCQLALLGAGIGAGLALFLLAVTTNPLAVVLTAPTWAIGYLHAPQLDTNPATTTLGYPTGIGLAVLGGYVTQTAAVAAQPLIVAAVMVVLLAGVKIIDDAQDYDYDRSIAKRTVAVHMGMATAHRLAFALMWLALAGVLGAVALGVLPPTSVGAGLAFAGVALVARRSGPELATKLLIRGAYVFLAVLVAAVWFQPLN
jgi:4-hydroxybenzoate polyprenyltransferase